MKPYIIGIKRGDIFIEKGTNGMDVVPVDEAKQLMYMLDKGRTDVVVLAKVTGLTSLQNIDLRSIHAIEPPIAKVNLYYYLHKKNGVLLPKLTKVLKAMEVEGRINEIRQQEIAKLLEKKSIIIKLQNRETQMKYLILCLTLLCVSCANNSNDISTAQSKVKAKEAPLSILPDVQREVWAIKWWMPRHQEKLALKEKMGQVDLVFLGDSITHAWDNKGKDVWNEYYSNRNALNIGFSADRTEHVLWRLNNGAVDGIDPKLLVLMIGTNNTGHRQDKPENTALGIKEILDTIEHKLPNTKVLLLAVFPRGSSLNDPLRKINDDINNIIKNFHDGKQIHYLNINHLFLDDNGILSKSVMKDLLHPNKDQYTVWAKAIEPKIKELMQSHSPN
ncbi:MAG: transporter substrate-binding domain-containing protein [Alteromonadaceae bacterium]|nr:transporter substrate-binding domain-containing protein [Alteromonadaceae bacterium]